MKNRQVDISKRGGRDIAAALAGNPNVGKSTLFNALTGMKQHTGNWTGKTVSTAAGIHKLKDRNIIFVDLPGTYSLTSHSHEETHAEEFIRSNEADVTVVVCDATCLERNLILALQISELTQNVILCVNLMDEAERLGIKIDTERLQNQLGIPVVEVTARSRKGLECLTETVARVADGEITCSPCGVKYTSDIKSAVKAIRRKVLEYFGARYDCEQLCLRVLLGEASLPNVTADELNAARSLIKTDFDSSKGLIIQLRDKITACTVLTAEYICAEAVEAKNAAERSRRIDKIVTGKYTAAPIMLILLIFILWLTVWAANYPSELLSNALFSFQDKLYGIAQTAGIPETINNFLVLGVYRVLAWVISVMLPPMAIFFPLFTLLEDLGYLPRVAFNLDNSFRRAGVCGKQGLTTCMGFGCNAVGVTGCRIIDSPRERLIAILTNSFVPCNGRFPTLIAIITMFFTFGLPLSLQSTADAVILTAVMLLGIFFTFAVSKLLSKTLLRGIPSSFTLELPPYRPPQIGKTIVRSIFDRTVFVLARAAAVAAPAGGVIWLLANIDYGGMSLLNRCADFLEPIAAPFGLDGVILMAFILGFPANEIVVPIMIMAYTASSTLTDYQSLGSLKELLTANGWTWVTAVCTLIFCLFHSPCSTTCLTIKKETGSLKWTLLGVALPTLCGLLLCFIFNQTVSFLGIV